MELKTPIRSIDKDVARFSRRYYGMGYVVLLACCMIAIIKVPVFNSTIFGERTYPKSSITTAYSAFGYGDTPINDGRLQSQIHIKELATAVEMGTTKSKPY